MNIIDPPGLTVMRIAGGRYRVTGAHRVVWRWMNKFSPASAFQSSEDVNTASSATNNAAAGGDTNSPDTDFDFGDLVTMTIIDVFETDNDGKLLSYCPTFDNRAVHKTRAPARRCDPRRCSGRCMHRPCAQGRCMLLLRCTKRGQGAVNARLGATGGALTQISCYRAAAVASSILLPVRGLTGATYGEATQHDDTTGIDHSSRGAVSAIQPQREAADPRRISQTDRLPPQTRNPCAGP